MSGGIIMPYKVKATAEEKVRIVEAYLSGKTGCADAITSEIKGSIYVNP